MNQREVTIKYGFGPQTCGCRVAPTEVRCEFLKSSFFVVAVFLWSNKIIIRINMHRERPETPTWPLGGGVKDEKYIFLFP